MQSFPSSKTTVQFKNFLLAFLIENICFFLFFSFLPYFGFPRGSIIFGILFITLGTISLFVYLSKFHLMPLSAQLQNIVRWLENPITLSLIIEVLFICSLIGAYLLIAYGLASKEYLSFIRGIGVHVPSSIGQIMLDLRQALTPWALGIAYLFMTSSLIQIFVLFANKDHDRVYIHRFYKIILAIISCSLLSAIGIFLSTKGGFISSKLLFTESTRGLSSLYFQISAHWFLFIFIIFIFSLAIISFAIISISWIKKTSVGMILFYSLSSLCIEFTLPLLSPLFLLTEVFVVVFNITGLCILWGTCYLVVTYCLRESAWTRRISKIVAVIGIILFLVNIVGYVIPYPDADPIDDKSSTGVNGYNKLTGENTQDYIQRMTHLIHESIRVNNYTPVPFYKNYFLFFYRGGDYEFCDYRRAVERGQGLCSQQALALAVLISRHGILSQTNELKGHEISSAQVMADTWWVLDPNYDVIVPYSIQEIENDPDIIRTAYEQKGYPKGTIETIVDYYGRDGNTSSAIYGPSQRLCLAEDVVYLLKWLIPLLLLFPYLLWMHPLK